MTSILVIDEQEPNHGRDAVFGACCFFAMVVFGIVLVVHFGFGTGDDNVVGSVAAGLLLMMGVMPTYMVFFSREKLWPNPRRK